MSSLNRFYIRFTWGRGWEEVFLWLLYPVIHRRVGKHARTHCHGLIFAPCRRLVYHFSNAKIFFDLFSKCNMQSPLRQLTEHQGSIVLLIKMPPQNRTHYVFFLSLLTHSLWIAPSIQPGGRALDWKEIAHQTVPTVPLYFKVWAPVVY